MKYFLTCCFLALYIICPIFDSTANARKTQRGTQSAGASNDMEKQEKNDSREPFVLGTKPRKDGTSIDLGRDEQTGNRILRVSPPEQPESPKSGFDDPDWIENVPIEPQINLPINPEIPDPKPVIIAPVPPSD